MHLLVDKLLLSGLLGVTYLLLLGLLLRASHLAILLLLLLLLLELQLLEVAIRCRVETLLSSVIPLHQLILGHVRLGCITQLA